MNVADWTPSPHVEREAAYLRRRTRWEGRFSLWLAGLTSVAAVGSGCAYLSLLGQGDLAQILVSGLLCVGAVVLTFWLAARDNELVSRVSATDRAKREEFGSGSGWIVDVIVLQGDAPTGSDRGMLWIEGSRLCFSGDRTSFALAPDGVAGRRQAVLPVSGLRHAICLPLSLRTPVGPLALSLRPSALEVSPLCHAIDGWVASTSTDGQFPPTRLGPGAISAPRLFAAAAIGTGYWIASALLVSKAYRVDSIFGVFVMVIALGGGWVLGYLPLATRWRAFRDRLRMGGE